jgi:hypothetical protein
MTLPDLGKKVINRFYPPSHFAFYMQRTVLEPSRRRKVARFLARRLPNVKLDTITNDQLRIVREVEHEGFSYIYDLISPDKIRDVMDYLKYKRCYDRERAKKGDFHISNAPPDCHVAPYKDSVVVRCPHLLAIANHSDILAAIQRLFGCKPTLSQLSVWWSLPGHTKPEQAEFFHRDVDEWQFIKLFVYLTDVDAGSGPHVFVKGSPCIPKLLPIKRYQDWVVEREFGAGNIIEFTGKAGTAFLENTFGLHKGQMPTSQRRLIFQAQYSLLPIGLYKYSPLPREGKDSSLDPYINRLYISPSQTGVQRTSHCEEPAT